MKEFGIFIMYLHYCHESNFMWMFIFELRILSVTAQPPNPVILLKKEKQSRPFLSGGLEINAKCVPMIMSPEWP